MLRHLDGHAIEVGVAAIAAAHSAAWTQSTLHTTFVAYTYLPEFDTATERSRHFLYKIAEVHALIGSEVKRCFTSVKTKFGVHHLHVKFALVCHRLRFAYCLWTAFKIYSVICRVLWRGFAHDGLQFALDFAVVHFTVGKYDFGVLQSACRFHNCAVTLGKYKFAGRKIIYFTGISELNTYYCLHLNLTSEIALARSSMVTCKFALPSSARFAENIFSMAARQASIV